MPENMLDLKFKGETLEREEIIFGIKDFGIMYEDDDVVYVKTVPVSLSSILEAVLPWLGKAIADGCFHNCSKPSIAESAFENATSMLKRLRY